MSLSHTHRLLLPRRGYRVVLPSVVLSLSLVAVSALAQGRQAPGSPPAAGAANRTYTPAQMRPVIVNYLENREEIRTYLDGPGSPKARMIQLIDTQFGMAGWRIVAEELTADLPTVRIAAASLLQCAVKPNQRPVLSSMTCVQDGELPALRAFMVPQLHKSMDMPGSAAAAWAALTTLRATDSVTFSRAIAYRMAAHEMSFVHEVMQHADYVRQLPELMTALQVCRRQPLRYDAPRCDSDMAGWIGHAGTAAAKYAPEIEALLQEDRRAHADPGTVTALLAAIGDLAPLKPILLNERLGLDLRESLGLAPPSIGVPFLISLMEAQPKSGSTEGWAFALSCYSPAAAAPAEHALVQIANLNAAYATGDSWVLKAIKMIRSGQPLNMGECSRHGWAWRNPT
jgi:hypothetical protein